VIPSPLLAEQAARSVGHPQLVAAALLGIGTVVLLITGLRVHPFLALILGSVMVLRAFV
jgi:gluconate:H+ symporter, GntP family